MNARIFLPGVARAILYILLVAALAFPAVETVTVKAASTISLRSAASGNNQTGSGWLVLPKPPGTSPGDVLIAQVAVSVPSSTIALPSGWHRILVTATSPNIKMVTCYKIATASEPASYTWTFSSSEPASGGIASFVGVNPADPIDASSQRVNLATSTASFTQVTTTAPNDMLLAVVGVAGNTTVTQPGGFAEAYERRDVYSTNGRSVEMSMAQKSTAGSSSVGSAKEDMLAANNLTQLLALKPAPSVPTPTPTPNPITIVAVGDMECQTPDCNGVQTPNQVARIKPAMFFPVGDLLWIGSYANFVNYYNPLWGPFFSISHPAIGNHDGNAGYYAYWNGGLPSGRAGPSGAGWYSFSSHGWHFVVLDSNCVANDLKVSCAPGSPQINWLQSDLAVHTNLCTIAFMHIPYYTSGPTHYPELQTIFQLLYNAHVELLITGHTHYYQRFYPQDANGNRDANGVVEIVAGTGGGDLSNVPSIPSAPNQAIQIGKAFGVLKLTLYSGSYGFQFLPAPGYIGSDAGSRSCR